MPVRVIVICAAAGDPTPHDGRYVVSWNPHTPAGILEVSSTNNPLEARLFTDSLEVLTEWRTISSVEPVRSWDRKPNRPLTGITVNMVHVNPQPIDPHNM
jgi:hypothetical protein